MKRFLLSVAALLFMGGSAIGQVTPLPPGYFQSSPLNASGNLAPRPITPYFPGISTNALNGIPGMNFTCTGIADCGWVIFQHPAKYPAANDNGLYIVRQAPQSGGNNANVYTALNVVGTSGVNDPGNQWTGAFVLYNQSIASTGAGNLALNATAFITGTAQVGNTWAFNSNCTDQSGVANPTAACAGAEIDVNSSVTGGTDINKERVGLQIAGGSWNGNSPSTHIGRLLLLSSNNQVTIDNAIELGNAAGLTPFILTGGGEATFTCDNNHQWSSSNYAPCVIVKTQGGTNPAFGMFDAAGSNGWAFRSNYTNGTWEVDAMPALGDTVDPAVPAMTLDRSGNLITIGNVTAHGFQVGGSPGVTCSGTPTANFAVTNGIVTHC